MNNVTPTSQVATFEPPAVTGDERSTIEPGRGGQVGLPRVAAALSRRLYAAGVPVAPERAVTFAEALTLVTPLSRSRVYWSARAVFVSAPAHLPAFDLVFAEVFGGCPDEAACRNGEAGPPLRHGGKA